MTETQIQKIISFLIAKKIKLESEIEERNQENLRCQKRIENNIQASDNLKLLMSGYCDTLEELNRIIETEKQIVETFQENTDIKTVLKTNDEKTKLEINDILTPPVDYVPDDLKPFKTLRFTIDEWKNVILMYGTGTYYSNIDNIMKLPYPHQSNTFGNTWHNNNRAAVKLMREYLAGTEYDPDRGMYRKGINDNMTKVSKRNLDSVV